MPTCPAGHDSADSEFCDVCGIRITAPAQAGPAAEPGETGASTPAPPCPQCGTPRTGQFCEACGFDFASPSVPAPPVPAPPVPAPPVPAPPVPAPAVSAPVAVAEVASVTAGLDPVAPEAVATTDPGAGAPEPSVPTTTGASTATVWTAVVTADRDHYDGVVEAGGPDTQSIEFPGYCPQRRFRLSGQEMRIGRHSVSRGLEPEIDLTGPPTDPGVSHLHAVLIAQRDGGWAVLDPGSSNGTMVNGTEIAQGVQVPLHDGDQISMGAWTTITIRTI